ncbi:hypothetical protein [Flavobacterium sp. 25HG05S-40]|uniref:hypothetical protein n=1 Tax=Flavobacterium sp. 25HG05S-40 TaxID=3458682 RepID=UPI0040447FB1
MKLYTKILLLVLIFIAGYLVRENYQSIKYANTKLNIEVTELEQVWGKPDSEMANGDNSKVLKYKYWNGYYIFITDSEGKKIVAKFDDD